MSNGLKGTIVNPEVIYGRSAYETAVAHGYTGTEEDFIRQYTENKEYTDKKIGELSLEKGISEKSLKMPGNIAGLKGFYWSEVDVSNKIIALSTKNGEYGTEQDFNIADFWAEGDTITVHADQHHVNCSTITAIDGGLIYVDSIPFSPIQESDHHTDQAVYVLAKPDKGLVDFGQNSVVFGEYCKALGYCNFVAGIDCEALDQYSAVFGNGNKAKYAAGAFGKENEAMGDASFVAGGKSKANGKLAVALGRHLNVEGEYNFSANSANKVYGRANAAFNGSNAEFPNDNTTDGNTVRGVGNLVIGHNNSTDDNAKYSFVGGDGSFATNENAMALGYHCNAKGLASQAMGYDCNALGNTSHAGGARSEATGSGSFAHGDGVKATARCQAVFGLYNATNSNALFQIGNGSSDTARSNAFEVLSNGIKIGNTTITEAQLIKLLALLS